MKQIITFFCLVLMATAASAQQKNWLLKNQNPQHRQHLEYMLSLNPQPEAKTTATAKRVKAESTYDYNQNDTTRSDTTHYQYSGSRGSVFNFNYMVYRSIYQPVVNPSVYPYDNENLEVKADTVLLLTKAGANLKPADLLVSDYTAFNKIAKQDHYYSITSPLDNAVRYVVDYNTQGKASLLHVLTFNTVSAQFDTSFRRITTYNTQGQIATDSVYTYDFGDYNPQQGIVWTYFPNGKIDTIKIAFYTAASDSWSDNIRYTHEYYPNGSLQKVIASQNFGAGLMPVIKDTFSYANSAGSFWTTLEESTFGGPNTWVPSQQLTKHLNAAGYPDTMYIQAPDASNIYQTEIKISFEYNSVNLPVTAQEWDLLADSLQPVALFHYYYEDYQTASIKNTLSNRNSDLMMFPNPVENTFTIRSKEMMGKKLSLTLSNISGQRVHSQTMTWQREEEIISVQNLPTGIYLLTVQDEAGSLIFNQKVIKQ